jgi:flagellar biosynthesis protein FlhF
MDILTFRAAGIPEAVAMVRAELGPDASLLSTREVRSGLLGGFRVRGVEVTAAVGAAVPARIDDPTESHLRIAPSDSPESSERWT